jgi:hypothetical protein
LQSQENFVAKEFDRREYRKKIGKKNMLHPHNHHQMQQMQQHVNQQPPQHMQQSQSNSQR